MTNSKLILRYYWPFKSDPPSQQQTAALLSLLPKYCGNDTIHILLNIMILRYILTLIVLMWRIG